MRKFRDFFGKSNDMSDARGDWKRVDPETLRTQYPWTHALKMSAARAKMSGFKNFGKKSTSASALMGPGARDWEHYPRDPQAAYVAEQMFLENGFKATDVTSASYTSGDDVIVDAGVVDAVYQLEEPRGETVIQFSLLMFKSMYDSPAILRLFVAKRRPDHRNQPPDFNPYDHRTEQLMQERSPLHLDLIEDMPRDSDRFMPLDAMIYQSMHLMHERQTKARVRRRGGSVDL